MTDWRYQGQGMRRRMGAPSSHLEAANAPASGVKDFYGQFNNPAYHCADCGSALGEGTTEYFRGRPVLDPRGNMHHLNNNGDLEEHRPVHKDDEPWLQGPDASGQQLPHRRN